MAQLENTFVKFNYCDKPGGFLVLNYSLLFFCFCFESFASCNGLFPLLDSYSDSDMDSCTMQDFSIGLDSDSDTLIKMYAIGMEICP